MRLPAKPRPATTAPRYPRLAIGFVIGAASLTGCGGPTQLSGAMPNGIMEPPPPEATETPATPADPNPSVPPDAGVEDPDAPEMLPPPGAPPAAYDPK